jgi:hypothetical protein
MLSRSLRLCAVRIELLSGLCEEAYTCSSDTMINCEAKRNCREKRIEQYIEDV